MPKKHKARKHDPTRGLDAKGNRIACVKCNVKIGKKKGQWNRTSKRYIGRCPYCGGYNTFPKYKPKAGDRRKPSVPPKHKRKARVKSKAVPAATVTPTTV